ncbi:MAG: AsmA family protein [Actinomycetota bacterium]
MKRLLTVVAIVVGVVIVLALALPLFVNVDTFRPSLEKSLSASLNRQVKIGKLSASLFSGGASASQISISDDPAFGKGPFLQAGSLKVGLHLMPLIFSRRLEVTGITVERPEIVLLKNAAGKWNYSTLGTSSSTKQAPSQAGAPAISVEKFEIVDGKVRVGESSGNKAGHEHVYDNVNLTARNIALNSVIPFTLTANTPGGGSLKLDGQAGPLNNQDSARTPFDAQVTLNHADLASTGFIDPSSGLAGTLDFNGHLKSDGDKIHSEGKIKTSNLRVIKGGAPAKAPVALDYRSDYSLRSQRGQLNADLHTGNSTANANGTLEARGADTLAHMKLQGKNMAVNDVQALLPAFGVVLPSGASLQGGTINMDMAAEGPLDRLVITGPLVISGTRLTGFDLGSKLGAIAALTGIKPSSDTLIQTVSSGLRVAPEGIRADNIVIDVPAMGSLTGNGVIGSNNSLDFKMLLKLSKTSGGLLANLAPVSTALQTKGVPFLIQGTTQNPRFLPALGNQMKGLKQSLLGTVTGKQNGQQGQQKQDLKGILGGLLDKKKKP